MPYPKCSSVSLWNFNRTTYNKDKCKTQQEVSKQMCVKPMNVLVCVIILIDDNIMASPEAERVFGGEGGERGEGIQSNLLHNSLHTVLRVEPAKPLKLGRPTSRNPPTINLHLPTLTLVTHFYMLKS